MLSLPLKCGKSASKGQTKTLGSKDDPQLPADKEMGPQSRPIETAMSMFVLFSANWSCQQ